MHIYLLYFCQLLTTDFSQCTSRCFNLASKYLQFIFATFKKAKQAYCGPLYLLGPQLVLGIVLPALRLAPSTFTTAPVPLAHCMCVCVCVWRI